jgi:hypothetical protein
MSAERTSSMVASSSKNAPGGIGSPSASASAGEKSATGSASAWRYGSSGGGGYFSLFFVSDTREVRRMNSSVLLS